MDCSKNLEKFGYNPTLNSNFGWKQEFYKGAIDAKNEIGKRRCKAF